MTAGTWIDAAWQDRGLKALRDTLDVDPRHRRAMIEFLFAEGFWDSERLSWDAAIARWNDCLNPGKASFFKLGELWGLMARFGRHDLFHALADDLGYEVRRKPTEERRQALMERMCEALEHAERQTADIRSQMARIEKPLAEEPVNGLRQEQPSRFAREAAGTVCF